MTMTELDSLEPAPLSRDKFRNPAFTITGARRAFVALRALETLWINTGTLCNITCANCYIESSPTNDRLAYITADEVKLYLDEIKALNLPTTQVGFTGGEPFMNQHFCDMLTDVLSRGFGALILTNAMQPLMRPDIMKRMLAFREQYAEQITVRVSLDHHTQALHDKERGAGAWAVALKGLRWLSSHDFTLTVAGRTCWGESEDAARAGYAHLFRQNGFRIDADDPEQLILFPEMDAQADVPEITEACWKTLHRDPGTMMCATSRMVVKRKNAAHPTVLPCTLLPYDARFDMGAALEGARGNVMLNHPHCAKFCVLGGGSCSG